MKKTGSPTTKFVFRGFENLSLTQLERDSVVVWQEALDVDALDAVVVLCEAGYKVGISYDDYRGSLQGALTCKDSGSKYYGYCFTLSHSDPKRLLYVLRWFYDTMLKTELYVIGRVSNDLDW